MKKLFLIISLFIFTDCKGELQKVEISIPTAQCGMCANTITESLKNVDGVERVNVNMDKLMAFVAFNTEKTTLNSIETAIADAGYQANMMIANDVAYKSLPACCRLPKDR